VTSVRRVIPIVVGWERLPKSYSVHGDTSGLVLVEPVPVVLLDTDTGWTLVDTGINTALVRDRPLYERLHGRNHAIVPILPAGDGEPLERALAAHGVALADVKRIYLSHLHNDHARGLRFDDPEIDWRLLDGDAELAPGISAVLTPGHTPGHQSFELPT
jgi:N-acyl homoserine lactone hydrolase